MKLRVFLDTNVFIYAFEFPECNSDKIIDLLNKGRIEAVISERVLREVQTYFKKFYNKDLAATFRDYLLRTCTVVLSSDVKPELRKCIMKSIRKCHPELVSGSLSERF